MTEQEQTAAAQPTPSDQSPVNRGLPPSIWDNLPESDNYVKFTLENNLMVQIRFIDNEPRQVPSTRTRGKMNYEFEVIDLTTPEPTVKIWSVSSMRLMRSLSALVPLDGKSFQVVRTGEGMAIDYTLTRIK